MGFVRSFNLIPLAWHRQRRCFLSFAPGEFGRGARGEFFPPMKGISSLVYKEPMQYEQVTFFDNLFHSAI